MGRPRTHTKKKKHCKMDIVAVIEPITYTSTHRDINESSTMSAQIY